METALAALRRGGVLVVVDEAERQTLERFATRHGLPLIAIKDLARDRQQPGRLVRHVATEPLPTLWGEFTCHVYESLPDQQQHLALVMGTVEGERGVLVRVHSECLTGDTFGSRRCDCGPQLATALARVAAAGRGVVVYLRGHEGRGIGLAQKIRAYELQDQGHDTVDANLELGLPVDKREYDIAAQMLVDLKVGSIRLMTNNPSKYVGLAGWGLEIAERVPLEAAPTRENLRYLRAKQERLGHLLAGLYPAELEGDGG